MGNIIKVQQIIEAVESVREDQRVVQRSLGQLLEVLNLLNTQEEIAILGPLPNPGRVGKVCSVVTGSLKRKNITRSRKAKKVE